MKDLNVTILIPTCNRPVYLSRCLEFYHQQNESCEIIVLDSSDNEQSAQVASAYPKVSYVKYPNHISFSEKLSLGGSLANHPFITICSDDDFIFPEGISACVNFLARSPDYSCAHGKYLRHWFDENDNFRLNETYTGKFANMLDSDLPALLRLQFHYADYTPTFYAVTRREVFCKIYQQTAELGVEFGLSEVLPSSLTVIFGKIARLPVLYASREAHHHNWVTPERKLQMYSQDKMTLAKTSLLAAAKETETAFDIDSGLAILDPLLQTGIGMVGPTFNEQALKLRDEKSLDYFSKYRVTAAEFDWALKKLAQILLKNKGYSRQDMIKLREKLYLTAETE